MKLIVGLGNPGDKFKETRHNAGWLALDYFQHGMETINCQSKFGSLICEVHFSPHTDHASGKIEKVFFVKPQTFMNRSGEAVRELCQFYKVDPKKDVLIVHDEADLPLGSYRIANNSSAAGHNGVKNIFEELGTQEIKRLRIGVESRESRNDLPTDVFVLQPFKPTEIGILNTEVFPKVKEEIEKFIHN
jgi:peptidyl-tRNA hydrolase, PTH1 family